MMRVDVAVTIAAPRAEVWSMISGIEEAANTISGIDEIEVLERPERGILGLKWRETRTLYGRTATETMWITAVEEGSYYTTEARSHGAVYRTNVRVADAPGGTRLSMEFTAEPQTLAARLMSAALGFMIRKSVRKALLQDLEDVKAAADSPRRTEHPGQTHRGADGP
jgi:carbon monoxide dehydrogenase subunit G